MTQQPDMKNRKIEQLPGLCDGQLVLSRDDVPEGEGQASIVIAFSEGSRLRACYWRVQSGDGTVISSFDDKKKYGLPNPIDAVERLRDILQGNAVVNARIDRGVGDLIFDFNDGTTHKIFGFTANEIWDLTYPAGTVEYSNRS